MTKLETGLIIGIVVVLVIVAATLFGGGNYIKELRLQIEGKTEKQAIIQGEYDALTDSIENRKGIFVNLDKVIDDAESDIENTESGIEKINEDYEDAIDRIADDDVVTDYRAVTTIFKEHDRND